METKNVVPEVKVHKQLNPFMGKTFKVVTYNQVDQPINSEVVEIESQEDLKRIIESINQFNSSPDNVLENYKRFKKLITE